MQENLNAKSTTWVGVDVSKLKIDVAVLCGEQKGATFQVARTEKGEGVEAARQEVTFLRSARSGVGG